MLPPLLRFPPRPDFPSSGAFAQVRKCVDKMTGRQYAMKIIDKKKFMSINSSGRLDSLMDEVNILRAADHPGIIKMYDVIETPKTLYVVLEMVTGGDLFDRIVEQDGKGFSEEVARYMFEQMLAAIKYLHGRSIVHRGRRRTRDLDHAWTTVAALQRIGWHAHVSDAQSRSSVAAPLRRGTAAHRLFVLSLCAALPLPCPSQT